MSKEISLEVAVRALQRLYKTFTGRDLPATNAKELLEQTRNETQ